MAFCYISHILCYIAHAYTMLYSLLGYIASLLYSILLYSTYPQGIYKPPAVPSGAAHCAQGAHYPAGTRGDIQAVTQSVKLEFCP